MQTFDIAGAQFRNHEQKAALLEAQIGDECKLIPDPTNKYDMNAIEVHFGSHFVGFVPKTQTEFFHGGIKDESIRAFMLVPNGYYSTIAVVHADDFESEVADAKANAANEAEAPEEDDDAIDSDGDK
jgi:hypothetical protein